eukprot:465900-Rhodomonas_salina.1
MHSTGISYVSCSRCCENAGAQTLIVWVKAHVGDIGTKGADQAADRGCRSDDIQYNLITYPFRI